MIDQNDISRILSEESSDLKVLCTSKNINKWSRRKPMDLPTIGKLIDDEIRGAHYGLTIPLGIRGCNQPTVWEYARPKGGRTSPYRLGDFDGYSHEAPAAVEVTIYGDEYATPKTGIRIGAKANMDDTNGGIMASELMIGTTRVSDMYLGMMLRDNETKRVAYSGTSVYKIGEQEEVAVGTSALADLETGEYELIVFLCENQWTPQVNATQTPVNPVTVEQGARLIWWENSQTWYGHVMWSSHKRIDTPETVTMLGNIQLQQNSNVSELKVDGADDADIRRRLTIRNQDKTQRFSNYNPHTTGDYKSSIICLAAWDDMTDMNDSIIVGICYRYKGQSDNSMLGSAMMHEQGWERKLMVLSGSRIVYEEGIGDNVGARYVTYAWSDAFGESDGTLTYPQGRKLTGIIISNRVRNSGSRQDYSGVQICLEMENGERMFHNIGNAHICMKADEDYSIYIDGYSQRYDDVIDDDKERIVFRNESGATECDIDLELLNPLAEE